MITKETKPGQCVTLIELKDGRFIEIQQEENSLVITIPSFLQKWSLRRHMAILVVYGIVDVFRKTILRFTDTHLCIERHPALFPFKWRMPLERIGEARCEMFDDLYMGWPEDIVTIPLGTNDCFNIHHIKTLKDQEYIADIINSFLTQKKTMLNANTTNNM